MLSDRKYLASWRRTGKIVAIAQIQTFYRLLIEELMTDINNLRRILTENKTIAVVGLSANWWRPSFFAAKYMQDHGYRIVPVNPNYDEVLG